MNNGRAQYIFQNISDPAIPDGDKGAAIQNVMNRPTHNSITKNDMIDVIKYLWDICFELRKEDT